MANSEASSDRAGEVAKLRIGSRVVDANGFRATVRYVGPVSTAKDPTSLWIGVEFDDPSRGKHDGAVEKPDGSKQRYFSCLAGGSGSFLKPGKFSAGVSMAEALRHQYVGMDAPLVAPENLLPDAYASTSKGGKKPIEFYGESKIRRRQQVDTLDHCTLREANVSRAGELGALSEAAGAFVHVDLKANLLSDWEEVGLAASQMPILEVLSIGSNRMSALENGIPPSMTSGACERLRVLEITSCGISSWSQVAMLGVWAPSLEELCAADNDLSDVADVVASGGMNKVGGFRRLRSLDLSETKLSSWNEVMCFSTLPALTTLLLNHNRLEDVDCMRGSESGTSSSGVNGDEATAPLSTVPSDVSVPSSEKHESGSVSPVAATATASPAGTDSPPFESLEAVSLSGNRIADWGAIDRLSSFPALRSLRFSGNPVTSGLGASEARAACVARLSSLHRVNGSECGKRERADAEKLYLRMLRQEVSKAQRGVESGGEGLSKDDAERAVASRHPRYRELWKLHGESIIGTGSGSGAEGGVNNLAASMAQVTLTSLAAASCTTEPAKKRLPGTMTVGKLKQLCKRLFKIDTDQQILSYRPEPGALLTTLDNDDKTLSYFGVGEGSEVLVDEVDEKKQARVRERAKQEEETRLADQLRHAESLDAVKRMQVTQDTASAQAAAGK